MKFSDAYKNEMDKFTVSEATVNKLRAYSKNSEKERRMNKMKFMRTIAAATCALMLITSVYVNRDIVHGFVQSIYGSFIFNIEGNRVEVGEIDPINVSIDEFITASDVNVLVDENNNKSYWKNYSRLDELQEETGIMMIRSPLLEDSSSEVNTNVHFMPDGYGHFNVDYMYETYNVNVDGMFTYAGYEQDTSGYGYGTSEEDKYDFTYKTSSGLNVYFVNHSNGVKLIFQANNILYQINSDAPVKELKKLVETFKF